MLNTLMHNRILYETQPFYEQDLRQGHLERALYYRQQLYPLIDNYLSPQNLNIEAQKLQKKLEEVAEPELYQAKYIKAKILGSFIDEIFSNLSNVYISSYPSYLVDTTPDVGILK